MEIKASITILAKDFHLPIQKANPQKSIAKELAVITFLLCLKNQKKFRQ
jgi:hypothetical protein